MCAFIVGVSGFCYSYTHVLSEVKPEVVQVLHGLKKYSETKAPEDFSVSLRTEIVRSLPHLFDLEKITKYEVAVYYPQGSRKKCWSTEDGSTGGHISELGSLLTRMINLKHFSWDMKVRIHRRNKFKQSDFLTEFEELQAAFTNMQRLESLALLDYLFHPSFFLIPPSTVKKLEYGGYLSRLWWRRFAEYPFPGVEDMHIRAMESSKLVQIPRFPNLDDLFLEDVAITRLKNFTLGICQGTNSYRPVDLGECILRKNTGLRQRVSTAIAKDQAHLLINRAQLRILQKIENYKPIIVNDYTSQFMEDGTKEDPTSSQLTQDYLRILIHGPETGDLESWKDGGEQAMDFAQYSQIELHSGLYKCIDLVQREYTSRLANGENLDQNSFTRACVQMFSKWPNWEGVHSLTSARARAETVVEGYARRLIANVSRTKDKSELVEKYTERFFEGGGAEVESVTDEWVQKIVKRIEEEEEAK